MRLALVLLLVAGPAFAAPLVEVRAVAPTVVVSLGYATTHNFTHEELYPSDARCLLAPDVAAAIARVEGALGKDGLHLELYDCYRPPSAQRKLWAVRPDPRYVADPQKGSRHGRGAAVDVTLVDARGRELEMPSAWDDGTVRSHRDYAGASATAIANRARLEAAMKAEGFVGLPSEWWHFDASDWLRHPQLDEDIGTIPRATKQLVVVTAPTWSSQDATLQRYARTKAGWQPVGASWPVVLGRGLGWGLGAVTLGRAGGPQKREGDRRSPAGLFRLGDVTGYAKAPPVGTTLPYRQATSRLYCVDGASPEYNRFAEKPATGEPAWTSTEPMRRADELYERTIFVEHNAQQTPGAGSCIFLHVWRGAGHPTIGCTAMPLPQLELLIGWLSAQDQPLLLQLPQHELDALRLF